MYDSAGATLVCILRYDLSEENSIRVETFRVEILLIIY